MPGLVGNPSAKLGYSISTVLFCQHAKLLLFPMKKYLITLGALALLSIPNLALAGDCTNRDTVNWHATVTSAVWLRDDCPTDQGNTIATIPAGEVVEILEVDKHREFFKVRTSVGEGFLYVDFLKDIKEYPKPGSEPSEPAMVYENSIFPDLNPNHIYYDEIADVKAKGIVSGNDDGTVDADGPINRAALAKILVEATTDDTVINNASLAAGTYSDIESGSWYVKYLAIARDKGIVTGDAGKTTVRPADNANGAEVAKMIAVAFNLPTESDNITWYVPYFTVLEDMGALPYSDPNHTVTRGEMMFAISKVLEYEAVMEDEMVEEPEDDSMQEESMEEEESVETSETVVVNTSITELTCIIENSTPVPCDMYSIQTEIDLTEDSDGEKYVGIPYVRVYENGEVVAEKALNEKGVETYTFLNSNNFKVNFSLTLLEDDGFYRLRFKNDGAPSGYDQEVLKFTSVDGGVTVEFV